MGVPGCPSGARAPLVGWCGTAAFERAVELDYVSQETEGSRPALGVIRYDGEPQPLITGRELFNFWR